VKRFPSHRPWRLVAGAALLAAPLACGPRETAGTPETGEAAAGAASAAAAAPAIDLGSTRDTAMAKAFYPAPLESRTAPKDTRQAEE